VTGRLAGVVNLASGRFAMIEAGTSRPALFDVVVVHSFSRFFRGQFELEFYVRKLAKNCVKLVSITREMGDDPMHAMIRQNEPANTSGG
jgi:DNA invertase Pin-like site-specific DNA recombinase